MACNPCCCWNIKDGAVTIGIWATVYSFASLVLFGWQFNVLNNCRSVTMSQANLQCEYWCPCVGASNARTSALIEGLFVIQILCLIVAFFLLFASVALIYGAHTFSRHLVWPWFPCMLANIFCSLSYCIMWWTGDVRDYWLVLTILEMIAVFINLYCFVVVIMFYRQMVAERDYYESKQRSVRYDHYPERYDGYRKDNHYINQLPELDSPVQPAKSFGPPPFREEYSRLPDYYETSPPKSPYQDKFEPRGEDDMVTKWVKEQQRIGPIQTVQEHADSEPASPTKEQLPMLPRSLSVPSMYAETSGAAASCHYHCHKHHHHRHRSSSRHRERDDSRSRRRRSSHRHCRHHRSSSAGSRSARSYSSSSSSSDFADPKHRRHRSRSKSRYSDDGTDVTDESGDRCRHRKSRGERDESDRDLGRHRRRRPRQVKRDGKERDIKSSTTPAPTQESPPVATPLAEAQNGQWAAASPQGGITIPQHIIIPPSSGTIGPDGRAQPQTYQINSEIRISYDQYGRPVGPERTVTAPGNGPPPRLAPPAASQRPQPISITSIV